MTLKNAFENLAVEARQVVANNLLTDLRDTIFRRTDPLPAGSNVLGHTSHTVSKRVTEGRMFIANSGRLAIAGGITNNGGNMRGLIVNPANSGKNIVLVNLTCYSTVQGWLSLYISPTTGLPTAQRPINNGILGGGLTSVATILADTHSTTALSGGVDSGIAAGLPAGKEREFNLPPFILSPGLSLGLNAPFASAAEASFTWFWYE